MPRPRTTGQRSRSTATGGESTEHWRALKLDSALALTIPEELPEGRENGLPRAAQVELIRAPIQATDERGRPAETEL